MTKCWILADLERWHLVWFRQAIPTFDLTNIMFGIFSIKRLQYCWFLTQFNSKLVKLRRKQGLIHFHDSYYVKIQLISDFFAKNLDTGRKKILQLWIRTKYTWFDYTKTKLNLTKRKTCHLLIRQTKYYSVCLSKLN